MKFITKEYWLESVSHFKKVKSIALMSIFIAVGVVIGGLSSYFPLKVFDREMSLLFILWPIVGLLFGPVPSMMLAGIVDLLVFFVFPTGYPMYIGYTLTQMLIGLINGLFFYKSKVTLLKLFIAKFIINFGIHVGIESLFMADIMNYTFEMYKTYVIGGAIKNGIFLPIETAIMFVVMGSLLPVFKVLKISNEEYQNKIYIFK